MNPDINHMIGGYLDDTLSIEEHAVLEHWLKVNPENAQQFAQAVLLHDRLRGEFLAMPAVSQATQSVLIASPSPNLGRRYRPFAAIAAAAIVGLAAMGVLWNGIRDTPASAASAELNRIIAANAQPTDRTYQIAVEEGALPHGPGDGPAPSDRGRPPKPPMDGAVLHVRGGRQFVLVRKTSDGMPFITGSNGRTSWAVRPDGPVRVSSDLTRFNRDLPGHEHAIPLSDIEDGLEQLREAYETQLLPIEKDDESAGEKDEPSRLLVAVKKRGYRGPRRVEITYAVRSGQIRQLRFIEMPYGPERLTLRLTLVDQQNLGATYFDHESHHDSKRVVEFEE